MQRIAVFPGSFDPFTLGHKAIVDEGIDIFDHIVIGVGDNSEKRGMLIPEQRARLIEDLYRGNPKISVRIYKGLTVDFCRECQAQFLLRGVRNAVDFEYEHNMQLINERLSPGLTTVLLFTPPRYAAISSSIIRELVHFGGDPAQFLPEGVDLKKYF